MTRMIMAMVVVLGLSQASFAGQKCVTIPGTSKKVCVNLDDKKADGEQLRKEDMPAALVYIMTLLEEIRSMQNIK